MGNILRILKRDLLRLIKTPAALVVVIALIVLPSLYSWYNVAGFWDPYGNTGNLRVCVVNEDAGATLSESEQELVAGQQDSETLNVGDQIIEEIEKNHELDWQVVNKETAMQEVKSGKSYAAFVIPENFTANLMTLTTGDFKKPSIEYYVNEKAGPVSPKITDVGATTLDEMVNSTFVSTVAKGVATIFDDNIAFLKGETAQAHSEASERLAEAIAALDTTSSSLADLSDEASSLSGEVEDAKDTLANVRDDMSTAADTLAELSGTAADLQGKLASFSASALPLASDSITAVSSIVEKAQEAAGDIRQVAGSVQGSVAAAATQAHETVERNKITIEELEKLAAILPDDSSAADTVNSLINALRSANEQASASASMLDEVSSNLAAANEEAQANADALDKAADQAIDGVKQASDALFGDALGTLGTALSNLSSASSQLSAAAGRQDALITQATSVLDELSSTLVTAKEALAESGDLAASLGEDLVTVQTDFAALSSSSALTELLGANINPSKVADFMGSPTELTTERLYETVSYGAGMAPLFMNLTFWIGAFMLIVIFRLEVDSEGLKGLTLAQRYLGRFILLAFFAVLQAIICCIGIAALGVQPVNFPALVFAACITSLAYLSIIFALSVTFQHVGMGICVALVFVQIPGATGLYPIEMTPTFFQFMYPLFPFTYGIDAMREAICGFYGTHYVSSLGVLALFFVLFLLAGILLRPLMANVNRMASRQIKASGIYNGEDVEIPMRRFRFSQIMRALSDKKEYREAIKVRYERFKIWYPRVIVACIVTGIGVPVVLAVVFALTPTEKVVLLTIGLVLLIALFAVLAIVESLRDSFERQLRLGALSDNEIQDLYSLRNSVDHGERAEDLLKTYRENAGAEAPEMTKTCISEEPKAGDRL